MELHTISTYDNLPFYFTFGGILFVDISETCSWPKNLQMSNGCYIQAGNILFCYYCILRQIMLTHHYCDVPSGISKIILVVRKGNVDNTQIQYENSLTLTLDQVGDLTLQALLGIQVAMWVLGGYCCIKAQFPLELACMRTACCNEPVDLVLKCLFLKQFTSQKCLLYILHVLADDTMENADTNIEHAKCHHEVMGNVGQKSKEESNVGISLPPFGLAAYKLQGDLWIMPQKSARERMIHLYSAADSWLKQLGIYHHDFNFFTFHATM